MVRVHRHDIAHIRRDQYHLMPVRLMPVHANAQKRGVLDPDHHFFVRGDEVVAIRIPPQDGGEQPNQLFPAEPYAVLLPGTIAANFQPDVPAMGGVPQMHRRQGTGLFQTRFRLQGGNQLRKRPGQILGIRGNRVRHGRLGSGLAPQIGKCAA